MAKTFFQNLIELFEADHKKIKTRLAMMDPQYDPESEKAKTDFDRCVLENCLEHGLNVLARLTTIDNPANDQAQTSSRELVKLLCQRLNIDPVEKFGLEL